MFDLCAVQNCLQNMGSFIVTIRRNYREYLTTDDLLGGITEYFLRPPVPARNNIIKRHTENRIIRGIHDHCQLGPFGDDLFKYPILGFKSKLELPYGCLLYTSPSPRDRQKSRMPSSA